MLIQILFLMAFHGSQPGQITFAQLQAGYRQNADTLSKYRVAYTRKTVLSDGYKLYHSSLLSLKKDQLQITTAEAKVQQLQREIKHLQDAIDSYNKIKLQSCHFDYRTDGQNYIIVSPRQAVPWENVKESWTFPDAPITNASLMKEYLDYQLISYRPGTTRRYLYCAGIFNNLYNATTSDRFPLILQFPPLTKRSFTTDESRHLLDGLMEAQPADTTVKQNGQTSQYTVTFYGKDESPSLFTENEKDYRGRIRLRPETVVTFDSAKGYLPIKARMTGRIFLDGKAIEGANGEYQPKFELLVSKVEKFGVTYCPIETSLKEYAWDMKGSRSLSLTQLFHSKQTLRPLVLKSTTSWQINKLQALEQAIPKFELPDNAYIVDEEGK